MNYLDMLMYEYAKQDIRSYYEFDSSNFISNAKTALTNEATTIDSPMEFEQYPSMIEKAINSFSTITLDTDKVKDFLNKVVYDDNSKYEIRAIESDDSILFKPQYIGQYVGFVTEAIQKCIDGDNQLQDSMVKFISGEYVVKVEKQVVKSSLPYGVTTKDLMKEVKNNSHFVIATPVYIKKTIIPFVTKYPNTKNTTITEANAVLNSIKEATESVKAMFKVINKYSQVETDVQKVNSVKHFFYNAVRGLYDIVSYVSFMVIHKINIISSNVITCNKLYDDILNSQPATQESVFSTDVFNDSTHSLTDDLVNGKNDVFYNLASKMYDFYSGMPNISDIENIEDDPYTDDDITYNKDIYNDIIKDIIMVSEGLNIIGREGSEYLLVFDDIIKHSGFSVILTDRFQGSLQAIDDMSMYSSIIDGVLTKESYAMLLSELKDYSDNMQRIANIIHETYDKLVMLEDRFADNINGEFKDLQTVNELKIFLKDLHNQYMDLVGAIGEKFMNRLKTIGEKLSEIDSKHEMNSDYAIPVETSSNIDLSESVFDMEIVECEASMKAAFDKLQKDYFEYREKIIHGYNVVYEAENTTPTVVDNSAQTQQAQPASQPNRQQTGNQQQPSSNTLSDILAKLTEWFTTKINKLTELINKSKATNLKWIAENKDVLTNRSYSNVTVNVLNYKSINSNVYVGNLQKLKANISRLTPQTIQEFKDTNSICKSLIPFVPGLNIANVNDGVNSEISNQIKAYLTVGSTNGKLATTPIANSELQQTVVNDMIPYCEAYYNSLSGQLISEMNGVKDALDAVGKSINTQPTPATQPQTEVKKESVDLFFEADEPNKNTAANMNGNFKKIITIAELYCSITIEVARSRSNDYYKILNSLLIKPKS